MGDPTATPEYPRSRAPGQQPVGRRPGRDGALLGASQAQGSVGRAVFRSEEGQISGIRRQGSSQPPKRRLPGHALIEFVRWLRLDEGIARKSLFIENDGSRVVVLP
jgi:hypothetical protein